MTERKAEFVEPELVKYHEKLADLTAGAVGYNTDDASTSP
jgi:hypothetical protein